LRTIFIENRLEAFFLKGNQSENLILKLPIKESFCNFSLQSEGWPKAIAEGMFWVVSL
jgi:hypothetical protein